MAVRIVGSSRSALANRCREKMAVVNVGRRCGKRVHDFKVAVRADARFHPEMPFVALHRLMHFGVALARRVFGRARRGDDGAGDAAPGIGPSTALAPLAALRMTPRNLTRLNQTLA